MKFSIIFIISIIILVSSVQASPSTSGAVLLKQFVGSRAPAMGEAFVAISDDIYALHYNPAGLVKLKREFSTIYYRDHTVNLNYGLIGYGQSFRGIGTLAGSLFVYDAGKIEFENESGNLLSLDTQRDYLYTLGIARNIFDSLSLGVNMRLYSSTIIEEYHTSVYCMDIGTLYKTPINNLSLGFVMQNIGTPIKYEEEKDPLPKTLRFGTAYKLKFSENYLFIVSADMVKPNDSDVKKNFGIECSV
ncbi:MAG TPA: hypothetical protein DCP53_05315, partial [Elusimicrobia bacterium]|nr:hypothetical protein [Elusimicrobiota bacterium]